MISKQYQTLAISVASVIVLLIGTALFHLYQRKASQEFPPRIENPFLPNLGVTVGHAPTEITNYGYRLRWQLCQVQLAHYKRPAEQTTDCLKGLGSDRSIGSILGFYEMSIEQIEILENQRQIVPDPVNADLCLNEIKRVKIKNTPLPTTDYYSSEAAIQILKSIEQCQSYYKVLVKG